MPEKSPADMTREELEAEVRRLRAAIERIRRKFTGRIQVSERLTRDEANNRSDDDGEGGQG